MKTVLEDIKVKVSPTVKKKSFSVRNFIWNYPIYLSTLFKKLIPLSYIILFGLVGLLIALTIQSNIFAGILRRDSGKDSLVGGVVGTVNSLNPLFVTNNYIDRSIDSLIFEKFIYLDKDGNPIPGIAKSWEVRNKGLEVDFTIDNDLFWHNGTELTIDDVIFTFDTAVKLSESGADFDSVGSSLKGVEIEKLDEQSVRFKLSEANPVFFQAVSIYIIPMASFENVQINQIPFDPFTKNPIGSGKYRMGKMDAGSVILIDNPYDKYTPHIKTIIFKLYSDAKLLEMSFRSGQLDAIGSWDRVQTKYVNEYPRFTRYGKIITDREKMLFFNTRKDSLKSKEMRKALSYLLDKEQLMKDYGVGGEILNGPLPATSWAYNSAIEYDKYNPERAFELLKGLGYTKNAESGYYESSNGEILRFSISYFESPTNERLIPLIVDSYKREGVFIKAEKLTYSQITQEIVATRDFEILLYEVETNIDPDQYNLWHSLKSNYPDLNLSGYNYQRVDILLEEGRQSLDREVRKQKYALFQKYLVADTPVIFLYNPLYEYIARDNLVGVDLDSVSHSYERFHNIEDWYWK